MKIALKLGRKNRGYLAMTKASDDENWYNFTEGIINGFYEAEWKE